MKKAAHTVIRYPRSRLATLDLGRIALGKHHICGLLEVDVTKARQEVRRLRTEGKKVSFLAWMIKAIGCSLSNNRQAHAIAARRRRLVLFDDVDVALPVEREVEGSRVPLALLIKKTNEKSVEDIDAELERAIRKPISTERDYMLHGHALSRLALTIYYSLPRAIRVALFRLVLFRNPFVTKEMLGTVIVTTVGTAGRLPGWIIPKAMHNLCIALGSIVKKPWVVRNEIAIRDILHMTVVLDHDVIDGIPARRFVDDLVNRIEKGRLE